MWVWLGGIEREGKKISEGAVKVSRKSNGNLGFALRLNQILCFLDPIPHSSDGNRPFLSDSLMTLPIIFLLHFLSLTPALNEFILCLVQTISPITVESDATIICTLRAKSCLYLISNLESPTPGVWQKTCLKMFALKAVFIFCFLKTLQLCPGFRGVLFWVSAISSQHIVSVW